MTRIELITIAKAIRNSPLSLNSRKLVVQSIISALSKLQVIDANAFRAMANAEDDEYRDNKVFIKAKDD